MMLTFMNSKLIIYIYIYIYIYIGEDQEFIHVFYWWIPLDLEIYTKCKKSSNLMKDRSIHIYIYMPKGSLRRQNVPDFICLWGQTS